VTLRVFSLLFEWAWSLTWFYFTYEGCTVVGVSPPNFGRR